MEKSGREALKIAKEEHVEHMGRMEGLNGAAHQADGWFVDGGSCSFRKYSGGVFESMIGPGYSTERQEWV